MKRKAVERNIVMALFILVLVTFTLAQRDSKRFQQFSASVTQKTKQLLARF
jgi:hypothetical protein